MLSVPSGFIFISFDSATWCKFVIVSIIDNSCLRVFLFKYRYCAMSVSMWCVCARVVCLCTKQVRQQQLYLIQLKMLCCDIVKVVDPIVILCETLYSYLHLTLHNSCLALVLIVLCWPIFSSFSILYCLANTIFSDFGNNFAPLQHLSTSGRSR